MSFNPLHDNLGNPAIKYSSKEDFIGPEHAEKFKLLAEHMLEISDDPSGSDPEHYLAEEDVQTLMGFGALAEDLGWPHASVIEMSKSRSELAPVWTGYNAFQTLVRRGLHKATSRFKNYNFRDFDPPRRTRGKI